MWPMFCVTGPHSTTETKKKEKVTLERQAGEGTGEQKGRCRATLSDGRESFKKAFLEQQPLKEFCLLG